MPIRFSEEFNVDNKLLEQAGVFDVILDVDTRVFVDPALLGLCKQAEFLEAEAEVENYFSNIIVLLRHSKSMDDMYWKRADSLLTFKEIRGTCLGYSEHGTAGNAIGKELRKSILLTIRELLIAGEEDPVLFELLGVFQERIGCDRISDLLTFILHKNILSYTNRVIESCGIEGIEVIYEGISYKSCINPYNGEPLLLLPATVLSPLPVAENFDDIDRICGENQRVRDVINAYFDMGNRKRLDKAEILAMMRTDSGFTRTLIESYKNIPKVSYDFNDDPLGEYIWCQAAKDYTQQYPIKFEKNNPTTINDVENVVLKICEQFKALIENNGLHTLLYDSTGKKKHESAAQLLFYGIADSYCKSNDVDLTRESNAGRGPVDFKLSRGAKEKVLVEVKLTSNSQLKHGIEKQLPIYMKQENTKRAIYLIIDNGHPKALENFKSFYDELDADIKSKVQYITVDAVEKLSASKA